MQVLIMVKLQERELINSMQVPIMVKLQEREHINSMQVPIMAKPQEKQQKQNTIGHIKDIYHRRILSFVRYNFYKSGRKKPIVAIY